MNHDVFIPTKKEFEKILINTMEQLLDRRVPAIIRRANRKQYLSTADFKDLTGCSYRVQQYLRDEGKIPFSQEGRKIFYDADDVDQFMDDRKIEAREE